MGKKKLKAQKRNIFGKKIKKMRRQGIIPGVIYGADFESLSIQFDLKEFQVLFREAGETSVIEVEIEEEENYPVLIKQVQLHALSDLPLHVDFHKIDLTKKVNAQVPVQFVGESEAVKNGAILLELLKEIEVEALPNDIPSVISVDISSLKNIGDSISVALLEIPSNVELKVEKEELVCKVEEPKEEVEEVKEVKPEDVEVTSEKKETEETGEEKPEVKEEKKKE